MVSALDTLDSGRSDYVDLLERLLVFIDKIEESHAYCSKQDFGSSQLVFSLDWPSRVLLGSPQEGLAVVRSVYIQEWDF